MTGRAKKIIKRVLIIAIICMISVIAVLAVGFSSLATKRKILQYELNDFNNIVCDFKAQSNEVTHIYKKLSSSHEGAVQYETTIKDKKYIWCGDKNLTQDSVDSLKDNVYALMKKYKIYSITVCYDPLIIEFNFNTFDYNKCFFVYTEEGQDVAVSYGEEVMAESVYMEVADYTYLDDNFYYIELCYNDQPYDILNLKWDYENSNNGYFSSFEYNNRSFVKFEESDVWLYTTEKMEAFGFMETFNGNGYEAPKKNLLGKIGLSNVKLIAYCLQNDAGDIVAITNTDAIWIADSVETPTLENASFSEFLLRFNIPTEQSAENITLDTNNEVYTINEIITDNVLTCKYDTAYETDFNLEIFNKDICCLFVSLPVFSIEGSYYTFVPSYTPNYNGECEFVEFSEEWQNILQSSLGD